MSTVKAIPEGHHSLTPSLVCKNCAKAIDFYKEVFHAKELGRMEGPGGSIGHAELQIGDSRVMLSDEFPGMAGGGSYTILYTDGADSVWERAVKAGAKVEMPLQNQFWGDRFGKVRDPFGHAWGIAQHVEDVAPDEMSRRAKAWMDQMSKKSAGAAGDD
jgi:PhnB protein